MATTIHLLLIDPQNSFCKPIPPDQQQTLHDGELCVPGAWDDMTRVANLIQRLGTSIDQIHVTLDSHQLLHVAHPIWFQNPKGEHPKPFTILHEEDGTIFGHETAADGKAHPLGEYTTTDPAVHKRTVAYLKELAATNRYPHCIWPPHCLIGTPGHDIVAPLFDVLLEWSQRTLRSVDIRAKGSNPFVEHFSAVRAEVPDPDDPATQLDRPFIDRLMRADTILLAGEAGSHCLANTVRDAAAEFPDDRFARKCVLLLDGTSSVPGFEDYQRQFVDQMRPRGMRVATCAEFLA